MRTSKIIALAAALGLALATPASGQFFAPTQRVAPGTNSSNTKPNQLLRGGANVVAFPLPTGSFTVNCGLGPLQYITNGGAYTITAPVQDGSCIILVTNNGSAGSTTFTGFTVGTNTGASLTTTNTSKFSISIWRINGVSGYTIFAHQA